MVSENAEVNTSSREFLSSSMMCVLIDFGLAYIMPPHKPKKQPNPHSLRSQNNNNFKTPGVSRLQAILQQERLTMLQRRNHSHKTADKAHIWGTRTYRGPEVLLSNYDPRKTLQTGAVDMFSFGLILLKLILRDDGMILAAMIMTRHSTLYYYRLLFIVRSEPCRQGKEQESANSEGAQQLNRVIWCQGYSRMRPFYQCTTTTRGLIVVYI